MGDRKNNASSCTVCRQRKVRCDQRLPCGSCIRHKAPESCRYAPGPAHRAAPQEHVPAPPQASAPGGFSADNTVSEPAFAQPARLRQNHGEMPIVPVFLAPNTNIRALCRFRDVREVVGVNPVASADERLTFWLKYATLALDPVTLEEMSHGVFTWHALVRSDPGLAQIWDFLYDFTPLRPGAGHPLAAVPSEYSRAIKSDLSKLQILDRIRKYQATQIDPQSAGRAHQIPLGLSFNDPNPENLRIDFAEELLKILPPVHVVLWHLRRFFRKIVPFFPFLDEVSFRGDVARVFQLQELKSPLQSGKGAEAKGKKRRRKEGSARERHLDHVTPQIHTPNDLATVGLLCIVLRISYLSLLSNESSENATSGKSFSGKSAGTQSSSSDKASFKSPASTPQDLFSASGVDGITSSPTPHDVVIEKDQDLLKVPIGIEMVDLAQRCLDHYQKLYRYNLYVMQLLVYMRIYQEMSPENTDGPSRDVYQLNNALLVQTAQMIGLHREPWGASAGLRKRLWCFIQFKDVLNALKFGSNFHSGISSDCILDPAAHDIALQSMHPVPELTSKMRAVARIVLNLDGFQLSALVEAVNDLERCVHAMGTLALHAGNDLVACLRVQYYLPVHGALMCVMYRLFGHYEAQKQYDIAYFYCKKAICIATQTFLPGVSDILLARHEHFDYALQMVVNPHLEYFMHRAAGFFSAWMVRLGNRVMAGQDERYRLRTLMQSFHTAYKLSLFGILKMNHRYCYAWRVGIIHAYILSCISLQGFYERSAISRRENVAEEAPRAGIEQRLVFADLVLAAGDMVFSDTQIDELVQEISHVTTALPSQYTYWHLVSDVVKFDHEAPRVYDPSRSALVFEVPKAQFRDFDLDWFPESAVNFNHVMETLFEPVDPMSILDYGVYD